MREPTRFAAQSDFLDYLDRLGQFRMQLGLHRIEAALDGLGLRRPPYRLVQVVGANGKGSTATFLACLAAAHGLKVGLYTSPHFLSPMERIRIVDQDGSRPLSGARWLEAANRVVELKPASPEAQDSLTYFEYITSMAAYAFAEERVDLAVFEAGLGGRWDATSVFDPALVLFTRIGLDHCQVLGDSIEAIAADKAGALKPGGRAVSCQQPEAAWRRIQEAAREKGAQVATVSELFEVEHTADGELGRVITRAGPRASAFGDFRGPALETPRLGLAGPHQIHNALTALAAWYCLAPGNADPAACLRGLAAARIPGRLQFVPASEGYPDVVLDGAHNPDGLRALQEALAALRIEPAAVIFACLADKDLKGMAGLVADLGPGPILVPELPGQPRALAAADVAAVVARQAGPRVRAVADLRTALAAAGKAENAGPVLICGSLFLLAEFFKLRPTSLLWS